MSKGRTRRKNSFISKEELIQQFPFLSQWEYEDVKELHNSLKLKNRSDERLKRVSQQEIDRHKSKNPILATLSPQEIKGFILSFRLSLLDRFDQESRLSIKKILRKKMLKKNVFPKNIMHHNFW